MRKLTIDPKYTKTYKTVSNLEKALEKLNLPDSVRYVQCEQDGRYTAIFINITCNQNHSMYLSYIASKGFKVVG